ncbi:hypothetical protein [Undibacterium sp. Ren11W]
MNIPPLLAKLLLCALLAAVLTLAFLAYLQPAFVLDLANRFILC